MAKGRTKINNDDSSAPAQPRSLRSRKRERLSEETSEPESVQLTVCHQDSGGTNTAVDATLPPCPEQEPAVVSPQQHQLAEESCPTEQVPVTEEKPADTTNVRAKDFEEQDEEKVTDGNGNVHQVDLTVHTDNDADQSGEDKEKNRTLSQTCPDVALPILEESKGSDETPLDEQLGANEDPPSNLERSQETRVEETSSPCTADVKAATKEAAAELPAKKKRRMGMCGLTEKERSHFLQTQKRDSGQKDPERVEMLMDIAADLVAQEDTTASPKPPSLSISTGCVSELNEAEIQLRSGNCAGDDRIGPFVLLNRAEAELHIPVTTSDGTSTVCDPGCSVEKSFEVDEGTVPNPEQTADSRLDLRAEEGDNDEEKDPAEENQSPAMTSDSPKPEQTEERGKSEAASLQVNGVPMLRDEKKEEITCDEVVQEVNKAGVSSSENQAGEFNSSSVVLCEATVTLCGSEGNYSCVPDYVADAVNSENLQTAYASDSFGPGCLDYVSDSLLNTISLCEEKGMERDGLLSSSDCHEDASDLVSGLVRELSSLNRKVMATHRELENLRRSTKSSRSSTR
ncbi:uncharacterized protein LOC117816025 [Notolabrus celidotus]|uniref:uncharacterized protein LOC117816025 n=1 Tax=Notolabrus celidotus TaxID=1203425 RepID=UPI0014902895|nr:uncharacterized protein LOC117816025 [Notolabrus celidotus]XP_034543989.1 uncharacterized protein LOC117816025 [Notolabrus celidotus]XP_034543990.1 uncharacterized protein LOC117816025 [Notolabrus celidotus]